MVRPRDAPSENSGKWAAARERNSLAGRTAHRVTHGAIPEKPGGSYRLSRMKKGAQMLAHMGVALLGRPDLLGSAAWVARHPKSTNWDVGEPWWNSRAIHFLSGQVAPGGTVFEWGSGGSTVWLATHGLRVTAIESEEPWAERVRDRCPTADVRYIPGADVGTLRSEEQLRDGGRHFFDEYVASIDSYPDKSFDLIVIDGICRAECAKHAPSKVKPGGLVVVDDSQWDFLEPCFEPFKDWEMKRIGAYKRPFATEGQMSWWPVVWETTFFRCP